MAKTSDEGLGKQELKDEGAMSGDVANDAMGPAAEESDVGKLETPKTQAISKNNLFILIGILVACGIGVAYFWISNNTEGKGGEKNPFEEKKPETSGSVQAPSWQMSGSGPESQGAVSLAKKMEQKLPEPEPPAQPPLLPVSTPAPVLTPPPSKAQPAQEGAPNQNRYEAKVKSSIMMQAGSGAKATGNEPSIDVAAASGDFRPKLTAASAVQVTQVGDLAITILQGKMIDSVLETPINTIYPGPIRAIISRDVYSEKGNNVLIPRGSKVIGTLKGGYTPGVTRVAVNWDRVMLPNGYDISIASAPGVNKLGMIGIEGIVNRQFIETIGSAALLSIINISAANMVEKYFKIPPNTSTTSTSDALGTVVKSQTVQSPTQQAAQTEFQNLSSLTKDWLKQNFLPTPYIVINQGTRLKIFVNQDIRFPKNSTEGVSFTK